MKRKRKQRGRESREEEKQRGRKAEEEKSTRREITDRNVMQRERRLMIIQTNWA